MHIFPFVFLRMADTVTSQNIDLSSCAGGLIRLSVVNSLFISVNYSMRQNIQYWNTRSSFHSVLYILAHTVCPCLLFFWNMFSNKAVRSVVVPTWIFAMLFLWIATVSSPKYAWTKPTFIITDFQILFVNFTFSVLALYQFYYSFAAPGWCVCRPALVAANVESSL
jgi:hypothetical protein